MTIQETLQKNREKWKRQEWEKANPPKPAPKPAPKPKPIPSNADAIPAGILIFVTVMFFFFLLFNPNQLLKDTALEKAAEQQRASERAELRKRIWRRKNEERNRMLDKIYR